MGLLALLLVSLLVKTTGGLGTKTIPVTSKTTTITSTKFTNNPIVNYTFALCEPQQVHLTYYPAVFPSIGITFSTWLQCVCTLQTTPSSVVLIDTVTEFVDGGSLQHTEFINFFQIGKLRAGEEYNYEITCSASQSTQTPSYSRSFQFLVPDERREPSRFLVLGDCGLQNFMSYDRILQEAEEGAWDVVLHNGDFAYDMDDNNGTRGDMYMNLMEPIVSYYPYMVSVGNHEAAYNFSHYRYRFNMPVPRGLPSNCCPYGKNAFYSWNYGLVHFVIFSSEVYFWPDQTPNAQPMFDWLEADLAEANLMRHIRPWIVVMGHRPFYSSAIPMAGNVIRSTLEQLFCEAGVDVILSAHEHNYERTYPVFNGTMCLGPVDNYTNYGAPVHLINGAADESAPPSLLRASILHLKKELQNATLLMLCLRAIDNKAGKDAVLILQGNYERHEAYLYEYDWSAYRASSKYGYGHLVVYNATHMYWEQIFDFQEAPIDSLWLIQEQHGAYQCHTTPAPPAPPPASKKSHASAPSPTPSPTLAVIRN